MRTLKQVGLVALLGTALGLGSLVVGCGGSQKQEAEPAPEAAAAEPAAEPAAAEPAAEAAPEGGAEEAAPEGEASPEG